MDSTALRPPLPKMVHLTTGHHDIDSGIVDLLDDLATQVLLQYEPCNRNRPRLPLPPQILNCPSKFKGLTNWNRFPPVLNLHCSLAALLCIPFFPRQSCSFLRRRATSNSSTIGKSPPIFSFDRSEPSRVSCAVSKLTNEVPRFFEEFGSRL